MPKVQAPVRAKQVGGVWLPDNEHHLQAMLMSHSKIGPVNGKATYQLHKLRAAMAHQPETRRGICLDIGAHVGLWSMHLVKLFDHTHAFEPVPVHADIFPHNVTAGNITLHRIALGERAGTVSVEVPEQTTGNAHVVQGQRSPRIPKVPKPEWRDTWHGVEMRTLDSFAFPAVDFIKIDVEGFELQVCRGARATIARCRPNIVVEQKGNDSAYGQPPNAALDYLRGLGMTPLGKPISGDWILGWPQ